MLQIVCCTASSDEETTYGWIGDAMWRTGAGAWMPGISLTGVTPHKTLPLLLSIVPLVYRLDPVQKPPNSI